MLAIIIPYYKILFFRETLLSLENQSNKNFKLYIGNDASPENPQKTIQDTLKNVSYEYFNYTNNLGGKNLAKQWKRVIDETKNEEWLMVLGDDDVLEPNFVEVFYQNLEKVKEKNITLIKFHRVIIDENSKIIKQALKLPTLYSSKQALIDRMTKSFPSSLSEHIFSRKTYNQFGFKEFPLAWHSDDLAILEFSNLQDFIFINATIVKVRISNYSISGQDNFSSKKQFATYQFCEYLLKNYTQEFPSSFIKLLIKRYQEIIWRNGFPLNLNLFKIFVKKNNYLRAIYSIKTIYELKKRIKSLNK